MQGFHHHNPKSNISLLISASVALHEGHYHIISLLYAENCAMVVFCLNRATCRQCSRTTQPALRSTLCEWSSASGTHPVRPWDFWVALFSWNRVSQKYAKSNVTNFNENKVATPTNKMCSNEIFFLFVFFKQCTSRRRVAVPDKDDVIAVECWTLWAKMDLSEGYERISYSPAASTLFEYVKHMEAGRLLWAWIIICWLKPSMP